MQPASYMGEEADALLTTTSLEVVVESSKEILSADRLYSRFPKKERVI